MTQTRFPDAQADESEKIRTDCLSGTYEFWAALSFRLFERYLRRIQRIQSSFLLLDCSREASRRDARLSLNLSELTIEWIRRKLDPAENDTARILLKNHLVHVIASDASSLFLRLPLLSGAVIVASSLVGTEKARQMVWDVPFAVVHGQRHPQFRRPRTTTRWWDFFNKELWRMNALTQASLS